MDNDGLAKIKNVSRFLNYFEDFMGYPTVNNFDINFILRTLENLKSNVPNTYTQLINSLLGLIILPRQWNIQHRRNIDYFNKVVDEFEELKFLNNTTFYTNDENQNIEIKKIDYNGNEFNEITIKKIIGGLRNSIAHQGIRPTKNGDSWEGVIFRSYYNDNQTFEWSEDYNFQMYLTMSELEIFTKFIAEKYLEEIKFEKTN